MTRIIIPQFDVNLVDVTVTHWRKQPGERVETGECLAELTTDKAVYELESPPPALCSPSTRPRRASCPPASLSA